MADPGHRPVLVVGAGPVGLAAALALRAHGLPATILEAGPPDRVRPGSRAIYVHGATLRLLERIRPGLGCQLATAGLVWPTRITRWRGREVFRRTYDAPPRPGKLPHFTSLPQVDAERLMLAACIEAGVELAWNAAVDEVDVSDGRVTLTTARGDRWDADYVIAADGARSAVRRGVGVELEGSRSTSSFVIVDVAEDPVDPLPPARIFHYEHPAVDRRHVLLVPFAGGWRADLQCRVDDDPAAFSDDGGASTWVADVLGPKYADRITWVSTYQFLQVVAGSFVDPARRVLLTGEAAHLFAPFGARGMNSGIPDADAAADAIAVALRVADAVPARSAVEGFATERRAAAEWNRACAGKALAHLAPRHWWHRVKITAAARAAPHWSRAGEWLDTAPYGPRDAPPIAADTKY